MIGVVKFIKVEKGYGFITADGNDFFFHKDEFKGSWSQLVAMSPPTSNMEGPTVFFKAIEHARGPRAIQVDFV